MSWILGYGCTSAAGPRTEDFWNALTQGIDCSTEGDLGLRAFHWKDPGPSSASHREILVHQLLLAWKQARSQFSKDRLKTSRLGVILASTKGCIDDVIWNSRALSDRSLQVDSITPVLIDFIERAQLSPIRQLAVSNACASAHSALFMAQKWIDRNVADDVIVLAADRVGPFVLKGFQSLRAFATDRVRPFAKNRSGLLLGEAASVIILSNQAPTSSQPVQIKLRAVGLAAEGFGVTRPAETGSGLREACEQLNRLPDARPDFIIAHGTATRLNDAAEDHAFSDLFSKQTPPVTATKWAIGHTLGASGGMDVIAACEAFSHQRLFPISNTLEIDPELKAHYILSSNLSDYLAGSLAGHPLGKGLPLTRAWMTSAGFGGINAAILLEASSSSSLPTRFQAAP